MKNLKFPLSWQIFFAGLTAYIFGSAFPSGGIVAGYLGTIYVKILSLILIPFVLTGVIAAVSQITNAQTIGRLVIKNALCVLATQALAFTAAIALANIIAPGNGADLNFVGQFSNENTRNFGDFISEMFPNNIFKALTTNNLCAIVLFSAVFGYFITRSKDKTRIFLTNFFNSASEVMMCISTFAGRLAPFGIFGIIAKTAATEDLATPVSRLLPFIITVLTALAVQTLVSLPIFAKIIIRCRPFRLIKAYGSVLYTAFGVSSSALALPMAVNRIKKETGVSQQIADFSMPINALTNNSGTSIYLFIAALFVAQAFGISIPIHEQIILAFAVWLITVGVNNVPLKFTVLLLPVLGYMGMPIEGAGLVVMCDIIFASVCPFVDMWTHICCTSAVAASEGEKLNIDNPKKALVS